MAIASLGCARASLESELPGAGTEQDAGEDASALTGDGDAAPGEDGSGSARDSGMSGTGRDAAADGKAQMTADASQPDAGPCPTDGTCESAMLLGEVDSSDSASKVVHEGSGSAWLGVDLSDGNIDALSTTRIGVKAELAAPAGSNYQITIVGDTGPNGGGRCVASDVSDTDPLLKTAIWGAFGPTTSMVRNLAVHVESLDGMCEPWTLTVSGSPCPMFTIGVGEDSMGSCE